MRSPGRSNQRLLDFPDSCFYAGLAAGGGRVLGKRTDTDRILREIESNWGGLVELSPDPVFVVRRDGRYIYVTPACARFLGVERSAAVGKQVSDFFQPDETKAMLEGLEYVFRENQAVQREERLLRDGSPHYCLTLLAPICDRSGDVTAVVGLARDITERKKAEEGLKRSQAQLRRLARHEQAVLEEERARIAREVHDEFGQTLSALKMGLSRISGKLRKDQKPVSDIVRALSGDVDDLVEKVRALSLSLRPKLLDDLGIGAAISWAARRSQERTGIECRVSVPDERLPVGSACATALYRIFQELLTNVARHAEATRVLVDLRHESGEAVLKVEDNGRGITEHQSQGLETAGLLGVRERVQLVGGQIEVVGVPGRGTTVVVKMPCAGE